MQPNIHQHCVPLPRGTHQLQATGILLDPAEQQERCWWGPSLKDGAMIEFHSILLLTEIQSAVLPKK